MSDDTFTLSIDMSNAEMGNVAHVAQALRRIAVRLKDGDWHPGHTRSVLDLNGNRVGSYRVPPYTEA